MKTFVRLEKNIVREVQQWDELPSFHPDLIWMEAPEGTEERDSYVPDLGTFTKPEDLKTFDQLKEERKREVSSFKNQKMRKGFQYGENIFQINSEAQKDMLAIQMQFQLENANPHNGFWMDIDNNPVVMTDTEVQAFFQAVMAYVYGIKNASWTHKQNIDMIDSKESLNAYNINQSWP